MDAMLNFWVALMPASSLSDCSEPVSAVTLSFLFK
jgi:hypothetical protein